MESVISCQTESATGESDNNRSTKKVRMRNEVAEYGSNKDETVEDIEMVIPENHITSLYRDKLLNQGNIVGSNKGKKIVIEDDAYTISHEGDIPTIDFSSRVRDMLIKGMERTLLVKLLGKNIQYHDLMQRIQSL